MVCHFVHINKCSSIFKQNNIGDGFYGPLCISLLHSFNICILYAYV